MATMSQAKNMPKDGQVIMAIMKEMGITEYEPKTVIQLTEFVYRYGSTILEEARQFANNSNKRTLELDHVKLALELQNESSFTMPPPREVALECARLKNNSPLPLIKPPCGLRLPPDRHCLSSPNYLLRANPKKITKINFNSKPNVLKRTNFGINKQTVTVPKVVPKASNIVNTQQQKTVLKPKIQITQQNATTPATKPANNGTAQPQDIEMEVLSESTLKRKREDGDDV